MNVLMTIAAVGAMAIGEVEEGAVTVLLFSLGELLENYSLDRARNAVRGLWSGGFDYFAFYDQMMLSIERGFTQAWYEGAAMYGIKPGELTDIEHNALRSEIVQETNFIDALAQAIIARNRLSGGKLEPLYARTELWVSAYNRVMTLASTYAANDQKHRWNLGRSKEHCRDCSKYNGKVHRMSVWRKWGAVPRSYDLACHGYHCFCSLDPTDEPATPGRPPSPTGR